MPIGGKPPAPVPGAPPEAPTPDPPASPPAAWGAGPASEPHASAITLPSPIRTIDRLRIAIPVLQRRKPNSAVYTQNDAPQRGGSALSLPLQRRRRSFLTKSRRERSEPEHRTT